MEPRPESVGGIAPLRSFAQLAAGPCPPFDEVLLSLSAELGLVDHAPALEGLDEHARRLFGFERLSPAGRVRRLGAVWTQRPVFAPWTDGGIRAPSCSSMWSHAGGGVRPCWPWWWPTSSRDAPELTSAPG